MTDPQPNTNSVAYVYNTLTQMPSVYQLLISSLKSSASILHICMWGKHNCEVLQN